jgi:hypothetical protein
MLERRGQQRVWVQAHEQEQQVLQEQQQQRPLV